MFSSLKSLLGRKAGADHDDDDHRGRPGRPDPRRMTLDERKAWRREMTYQSIREYLMALEVLSSMFRFRIMPLDAREHRFAVMVEVTNLFDARKAGIPQTLSQVEQHLRVRTYERYGIILDAVYWKVNEAIDVFPENDHRQDDEAESVPPGSRQHAPRRGDLAKAPAGEREHMARRSFEPLSEDERNSFQEAMRQGVRPPAVHVGQSTYESELAPLDPSIPRSSTRHGEL